MNKLNTFFLLVMMCIGSLAYAQSNYLKNIEYRAEDFFNAEFYNKALVEYKKLDSLKPNDATINYKLGLCLLYTSEKPSALAYLQKAQQLGIETTGFYFNLSKAYYHNYQFDKAVTQLLLAKKQLKDTLKSDADKNQKINNLMRQSINAQKYPYNKDVVITNLGASVNTQFSEFSPSVTADENTLIFTSCRPNNVGGKFDVKIGNFYEDLWISQKNSTNQWTEAKNMGMPINTATHDASVTISADGQTLILYRNENLYISTLTGTKWSTPVLLPNTINTDAWESCASISVDGKKIFFSSNKKGGFGGKDIYVSTLQKNGSWGKAINLGNAINTADDEEAPYIHPNSKTLYFSSNNTESIGGYDIFYSNLDSSNNWSAPTNMGIPINSTDDDLDFVWSADGTRGYFSSTRPNGYGSEDIYLLEQKTVSKAVILLKGKIENTDSLAIEATITITNLDNNEVYLRTKSNAADGKYTVIINEKGNYAIRITANNYFPTSQNLYEENIVQYKEITKDYQLQPIKAGSVTILRNVFFDFNTSDLKPNSKIELNALVDFLKSNKGIKLQISGHTDNIGNDEYNQTLSEKRAASVYKYLIENGIDKNRLKAIGFGKNKPVANNNEEEGRLYNRRIEIEIVQ